MIRVRSYLLAFAVAALASVAAQAMPVTVPAGLNPGDTYRLAFVTSTTTNADSTDINFYNQFVTDAANLSPELAALGTTWTAIASTATDDVRYNTSTLTLAEGGTRSAPIYGTDGYLIAADNDEFWQVSFPFPGRRNPLFHLDENGITTAPGEGPWSVWTGGRSQLASPYTFQLGSTDRIFLGIIGRPDDGWWVSTSVLPGGERPLYAISGFLTVPASMMTEHATFTIFTLGIVGLGLAGCRRRHRRSQRA